MRQNLAYNCFQYLTVKFVITVYEFYYVPLRYIEMYSFNPLLKQGLVPYTVNNLIRLLAYIIMCITMIHNTVVIPTPKIIV